MDAIEICECLHLMPKFLCRVCSANFFPPLGLVTGRAPSLRPAMGAIPRVSASMADIERPKKRKIERYRPKSSV